MHEEYLVSDKRSETQEIRVWEQQEKMDQIFSSWLLVLCSGWIGIVSCTTHLLTLFVLILCSAALMFPCTCM